MLRHRSFAAIFPIFVVLAVAAERAATWLLGSFPGEPIVWMVSGELRALLRPASETLAALCGGMLLQASMITLCLAGIWLVLAIRRWEASALVLNHLALITFLAVSFMSSGARTAGSSSAGWQLDEAGLFFATQSSGLQLAFIAAGVAGCFFSHVCFLREARARHGAVAAAITVLCLTRADTGRATRNRLSRSR